MTDCIISDYLDNKTVLRKDWRLLLEVKLTTSSHAVHVVLILTGGAKMQVTGHRLQATGQVTGHRSQVIQKKNNRTLDKTVLD